MLLSLPLLSQQVNDTLPHLKVAHKYNYVREVTNNRSPEIDKWIKFVGLNPSGNYNYCAAFVSYCINNKEIIEPKIRSARAQSFITKNSISSTKVLNGYVRIPIGSIVIWKKGETAYGHVGFVLSEWVGKSGNTIEANTSSGVVGNQSNGDGVYYRTRFIVPTDYFRITHFTLIKYER